MKTKQLIAKLKEIDPEGDCHVLIDNYDIMRNPMVEPMYWDGRARLTELDGQFPVRTKITSKGTKIVLMSVLDYQNWTQEDEDE